MKLNGQLATEKNKDTIFSYPNPPGTTVTATDTSSSVEMETESPVLNKKKSWRREDSPTTTVIVS
jgi:hypothetical protein